MVLEPHGINNIVGRAFSNPSLIPDREKELFFQNFLISMITKLPLLMLSSLMLTGGLQAQTAKPQHTFAIGDTDFMIDGKPIIIRCGEIHSARVPREYWRNRLQSMHAMGLNTVCAYLFWNFHEFKKGSYNWKGQADVAEFCKIAQEEGLWVVLRPGPYACAEWDGGGIPWWLLKNPNIKLRTQDPEFLKAATEWFKEVGRVLGPMQVTHGGPILMAQVETNMAPSARTRSIWAKCDRR